ncbi:hypothetical protein CR513_05253, partial [Mucuna pruriens]
MKFYVMWSQWKHLICFYEGLGNMIKVTRDRVTNKFSIVHMSHKVTFKPLSPKEVFEIILYKFHVKPFMPSLYVNLETCTFYTNKFIFLGYVIGSQGVNINAKKVTTI